MRNLIPSRAASCKSKIFSAFAVASVFCASGAGASDTLPLTLDECPLSQTQFNSWFQGGTASLNGIVNPANSITFNGNSNCDFYKWSEQMWLWATSPAPPEYGAGGRVFMSSVFYNVSPPNPSANNMRTMTPNAVGFVPFNNPVIFQGGNQMLQIMNDMEGVQHQIFVAPVATDGNSMIKNNEGQLVEIGHIDATKGGKAVFYDTANTKIKATVRVSYDLLPPAITGPLDALAAAEATTHGMKKAVIKAELVKSLMDNLVREPLVEQFVTGQARAITFVSLQNHIAKAEVGQAFTQGVLITQTNQLVYYNIDVNDVYAYYLTGRKRTASPMLAPPYALPDTASFPTSQGELNAVQSAFSKTFADGNALAMELKTSWVNAASLPDPQNYILRTVNVPVYNTANPTDWPQTGTQNVQLALLGMHLVGSTSGHREMIWGTYEHVNNSPRARFNYLDPSNGQHLAALNTGPNSPPWLLYDPNSGVCPGPTTSTCNVAQATLASNGHIVGSPVGPSNVIRTMAFGAVFNQVPNPLVQSPGNSNDEVIALNNHVHGMLPGDIRSNYVFTGATWTILGGLVGQRFIGPNSGNQVGTSALSNSTLETFVQGPNAIFGNAPNNNPNPSNCLQCHKNAATATFNTTDVSRVFRSISPLF
jgi:hypothetical protein